MKHELSKLILSSLTSLEIDVREVNLSHTKDKKFGDLTTNIAMILAKSLKINPRDLAVNIISNIPDNDLINKVEVAGPGFINFYLNQNISNNIIKEILQQQQNFGATDFGAGAKVLVEFCSANPTGPLHIGHGRGVAFGDTLVRLLNNVGFQAEAEYYVNDAGRQMDILAVSVYLRYIEATKFPESCYKGDYIFNIANKLEDIAKVDITANTSSDEDEGGDKERHVDDLIANAKKLLKSDYNKVFNLALEYILSGIKADLVDFKVEFDTFFGEKSLDEDVNVSINILEQNNVIYMKNGAKWFRTTDFNDEKDRVVVRKNGLNTYFASDIAYHKNKYNRGFDKIINIWGSDHHGYIARVRAGIKALGYDNDKLDIILVQFANLYRGNELVPMSTRSGEFVSLKELYQEVGVDAARFFYVLRKSDQHLDFDLELAKKKSNDNPVFYIQYAHARICSVLKKDNNINDANLSLLNNEHEQKLIAELSKYPEVLLASAKSYEVHKIAYYLQGLASLFHSYYNNSEFLTAEESLKNARLCLIKAVKITLNNGMNLLGVSCPETM